MLSAFEAFRKLYIALAGKHPNVKITLLRNQGLDLRDTSNVRTRAAEIEAALHRHFPDAAFEFHFAGAAELLALARKRPPETLGLPVTELLAARLRRASQGASLAIK